MFRICFLAAAAALFAVDSAQAGFMTYFGQDNSPGGIVPAGGNAQTARSAFLSNLSSGVGTENFESIAGGAAAPIELSFPGSTGNITATLTGSGSVRTAPTTGGFATSGNQFFYTGSAGDFQISFDNPIAAFGFYGTDIGDIGGNLELTLEGGGTVTRTLSTGNSSNGALLFWGFTDDTNTYTSIAFGNTSGGGDQFGFDDMTIGDLGQVQSPNTVPEPASLVVFGVIGLAAVVQRRRRAKLS